MGKSSELHKNTQNLVLSGPPLPPKEKYPLEEAILPTKSVKKNATKMPQISAKISFRAFLFVIQVTGINCKDWLQK